jgi:hypothetical protein
MKRAIHIIFTVFSLGYYAQTGADVKSNNESPDVVKVSVKQYTLSSNKATKIKTSDAKGDKDLFTPVTPSISPELEKLIEEITSPKLPFILNGYLDSYYFKNLNNPKNGSNTGLSGAARAFDQKENQFQLGLVQTKFNWNKKSVDAVVDLTFGPHADLGNYGNKMGPLGVNVGSSALSIKQAYVTYKLNEKNSFTVGQFGTHVGYEVIESSVNYHYSLSNLFNNGPFYHQGLKYTHVFGNKFNAMLGLVNNWDNLYDNNRFKTAVAQINYSPKPGYSFHLNYIGGCEDDSRDSLQNLSLYDKNASTKFKQMLDLVANMQLTKKINIGINAAIGSKSKKVSGLDSLARSLTVDNWGGVAAYLTYTINSIMNFGVRAEFFDNTSGIQYIGNNDVQSYTATFSIKLGDHLFVKPECRMDIYKLRPVKDGLIVEQQFMDSSGKYNKNSQITVGAAFICTF